MRVQTSRLRLAVAVSLLGLGAWVALRNHGSIGRATANPPQTPSQTASANVPPTSTEYKDRVVAYIYETIPITREDLGEYLIARMGEDRLNNLVNRKIIEHHCQQKGIEVTAAEVEADFADTLKGLGHVTAKDFEQKVLKPHGKTLYEWKEDVVKPRLMLARLCRDRVHISDGDLRQAFEAYYGEKVDCKIILWPHNEKNMAMNVYGKIRDNDAEFDNLARRQASAQLASTGGHISPMGRHTSGNEAMERGVFGLKPGGMTELIETPEGYVVVKCIKHIPADTSKTLDQVRDKLAKEVFDKKLQLEIPKFFNEMRAQAQPKLILKHTLTEDELLRDVRQELKSTSDKGERPSGN